VGCSKKSEPTSTDEPERSANAGAPITTTDAGAMRADAVNLESHADYLQHYRPALFGNKTDTIPVAFDELLKHSTLVNRKKRVDAPSDDDLNECKPATRNDDTCALSACRIALDEQYWPTRDKNAAVVYGRAVEAGDELFLQYYLLFAQATTEGLGYQPQALFDRWLRHNREAAAWADDEFQGEKRRNGDVQMLQVVLRRDGDAFVPTAIDVSQYHHAASMRWPIDDTGASFSGRIPIYVATGLHALYVDLDRFAHAAKQAREGCVTGDGELAAEACITMTPVDTEPIEYTLQTPPDDALVFQWRGYLGATGELAGYAIDDGPPMPACRAGESAAMWQAPAAYHSEAVRASTAQSSLDFPPIHYWDEESKPALARELNRKALELHQEGNYAAAIPVYAQALDANPRHILARYNLGCALSLDGQTDEALFVLEQLRLAGCKACRSQLAHARKDTDWKPLWKDRRFRALTGPADVEVAAGAVDAAFQTGKFEHVADFMPASGTIKYLEICSLCPPDMNGDKKADLDADGLRALFRRVYRNDKAMAEGSFETSYGGFDSLECTKGCCQRRGSISHNTLFLSKVCVQSNGSGGLELTAIHLLDGN
jgi:tetratricopeptide (TPR) repeat protein